MAGPNRWRFQATVSV